MELLLQNFNTCNLEIPHVRHLAKHDGDGFLLVC
jgi:hypothetical protein